MDPRKNKNLKKIELKFKFNFQRILFIGLILFLLAPIFLSFVGERINDGQIPISQVIQDIRDEKIERIEVTGDKLLIDYKEGEDQLSTKEPGVSFTEILIDSDIDPATVNYTVIDQSLARAVGDILTSLLVVGVMAAVLVWIFRSQSKGAQEIFSFGRSRAKLFAKGKQSVKFSDVAGVDEAKNELTEVVDFLKHPGKYKAIGARTPKGVLLVGPSGVGKCVTGDTIVWTNKGLMEIREIPRYYYVDPRSNQVYGAKIPGFVPEKAENVEEFASHWFDLGKQKTIRIRLAQGFELEGTPEHPVVVMTSDGVLKFRRLDQLRGGDYVAIQYGREVFGDLSLVDKDTAYLMGILTGDRNLSHASRIGLTSVDSEIIEFFKAYVSKRYSKSAITSRSQSYLVSSWDFKKFLYQMGMSYLISFDKTIPPTILQAPKEIQISFLQGLFDTDATVEKTRATFEYSTVSKKMATQVQMMLLNLGVVASLNIKGRVENGYYRPVYRLVLTGSAFVEFGKRIGFRLSRKQKLLNGHLKRMVKVNTNVDIIPGIASIVEVSWKTISERKLSNERLSKITDKLRRRERISRQVLSDYVDCASDLPVNVSGLEYLRSLLEAKLFFSKVSEISESEAQVYDFTLPQTHSFLGNGFINHNTLLARAVAGEAGVPFFSMAGSEFMEMLVGVGASRVRDLFATAKKAAPSIIFIDEIDAIGRQRGFGGITGGHDEREQTLNQILVEMDGFTPNDDVIVIAATNRGDLLDPALLRPSRFDRRVVLDMPDKEGREAILKIHKGTKKFSSEVDWGRVASRTVGFSGADLENMLNEAAILAARNNKKEIEMEDIEEAATKVKLGPARKRLQSKEDKKITAYHEAGHAIVTHFLPKMDPVHRISIVARGMSLGHTLIPPAVDRSHETKTRLLQQITAILGGRAAELLVFNEMTSGAANDIEQATRIARHMVVNFGMSSLGPIDFDLEPDDARMGRAFLETGSVSPSTQEKIDKEVSNIIDHCYKQSEALLKKHRAKLDRVAQALIKDETLDREDFEKIVGKKAKDLSHS